MHISVRVYTVECLGSPVIAVYIPSEIGAINQ